MELTEYQKEMILELFKNEKYPGWKNIATALIEKGECVVAGDTCIWFGGIGNFIRLSQHQNYFGCSIYHFNLESFLKSEYWKSFIGPRISLLEEEVNNSKRRFLEAIKLHEYTYEQKEGN